MKIVNGFSVNAPADQVFAYLLDVNKVVKCVPGASLGKVVDSKTFNGKLTVKAGAVTINYEGTAKIVDTQESGNSATVTVDANGKEIGGSGAVFAKVKMTVAGTGSGSQITIDTDVNIAGKLAQFGRNVVEDMAKSMINDMAKCISANVGGGGGGAASAGGGGGRRWGRR